MTVSLRARFALCVIVLVLAGCSGSQSTPPAPLPRTAAVDAASQRSIFYAAFGASDAVGVGGSVLCSGVQLPLTCPDNATGYVPLIRDNFQTSDRVTLFDLGINAAVISQDIVNAIPPSVRSCAFSQNQLSVGGSLLEDELPVLANTPVRTVHGNAPITIFTGPWDTLIVGSALSCLIGAQAPPSVQTQFIADEAATFAKDYASLISGVRQSAPGSKIAAGLIPNIGALPFVQGQLAAQQALQAVSTAFDVAVLPVLAANQVSIVDLLCDPRSYDPANYAADGFHPNDQGYAFLASTYLAALAPGARSVDLNCSPASLIAGARSPSARFSIPALPSR